GARSGQGRPLLRRRGRFATRRGPRRDLDDATLVPVVRDGCRPGDRGRWRAEPRGRDRSRVPAARRLGRRQGRRRAQGRHDRGGRWPRGRRPGHLGGLIGPSPSRQMNLLVVFTALLAGSLAPLNSTMIVVALPQILADLGASLTWGSWVIVSYLVAMAAMQPLGGSLGDRFGRKRLVILGLAFFLVSSLAAALATSIQAVIAARTAQAISGAITLPNGSAL